MTVSKDILDLATSGQSFRILDSDVGQVVPIMDIAVNIGYNRSTIDKIVKGYEGLLTPHKTFIPLQTSGGIQHALCLNRAGLDLLLLLIKPAKTRDTFKKFLAFRQKVLDNLSDGARIREPEKPLIKEELDRARLLAEATGGRLAEFQKIALAKCGYGDYAPALDAAPAMQKGETGWYNVTRLVVLCNDPLLNPERLNFFLKNKGYQYQDGFIWRLTPEGFVHGREYVYEAPSGHKETRIAWRESILYASGLKRPGSESQMALPVKAGVAP